MRAQESDKHIQIRDRERKIKNEIECDIEKSDPACSGVVYLLKEVMVRQRAAMQNRIFAE